MKWDEGRQGLRGRFPDNYAGLEKEVKPDGNHYHVLKLGETPKPRKTKPPYFRIPNLDPNTSAQGGTFAPGDLLSTKNRK